MNTVMFRTSGEPTYVLSTIGRGCHDSLLILAARHELL